MERWLAVERSGNRNPVPSPTLRQRPASLCPSAWATTLPGEKHTGPLRGCSQLAVSCTLPGCSNARARWPGRQPSQCSGTLRAACLAARERAPGYYLRCCSCSRPPWPHGIATPPVPDPQQHHAERYHAHGDADGNRKRDICGARIIGGSGGWEGRRCSHAARAP